VTLVLPELFKLMKFGCWYVKSLVVLQDLRSCWDFHALQLPMHQDGAHG
jgi:hypothetical protein